MILHILYNYTRLWLEHTSTGNFDSGSFDSGSLDSAQRLSYPFSTESPHLKPNYRRVPSYLLCTILSFSFHLLSSPVHPTGFSFCFSLASMPFLSCCHHNNNFSPRYFPSLGTGRRNLPREAIHPLHSTHTFFSWIYSSIHNWRLQQFLSLLLSFLLLYLPPVHHAGLLYISSLLLLCSSYRFHRKKSTLQAHYFEPS